MMLTLKVADPAAQLMMLSRISHVTCVMSSLLCRATSLEPLCTLRGLERLTLGSPSLGLPELSPLLRASLSCLTHLDLSHCGPLGDLSYLVAPSLTSLVLFDVPQLHLALDAICSLKLLR